MFNQKGNTLLIILLGILIISLIAIFQPAVFPNQPLAPEPTVTPQPTDRIPPPTPLPTPIQTPLQTPLQTPKTTNTPLPIVINSSGTVKINGDQACQTKTQQALDLLKEKAPLHFANVTKYIGIIECADSGSGMFAEEKPPRYRVGEATIAAGTIWYAGTIAHDANHSKLYHDYAAAHPSQPVSRDIWTGASAEAQCLDVQYDALSKIGASQSVLDYITNVKNTEYWNVSYQDRWW